MIYLFEVGDPYTGAHSRRVAMIAKFLGGKLQLRGKTLDRLVKSALLHDIGKVAIPCSILDKKGTLSVSEMEVVKRHPVEGAKILSKFPHFSHLVPGVLLHHERMDGSGYPYGLKDGEIPVEARIIAVADVFEALISERPYRSALTPGEAITLMKSLPLDREIVEILERHLDAVLELLNRLVDQRL